MNKEGFKAAKERLAEVNAVIKGLDPELKPVAIETLKPYLGLTAKKSASGGAGAGSTGSSTSESGDLDALIETKATDSPTENGILCLAVMYATHGKGPYAGWKLWKSVAANHNLTVPSNPSEVFKKLKRGESLVYRKSGSGWTITVAGEKWIKETYGVTKGQEPLPS